MHCRKNKSFTVNHFVAEGFLGYIIFFGLYQWLECWKCQTVGKRIKFCLKQIDFQSVKASVSGVVRNLRKAGNEGSFSVVHKCINFTIHVFMFNKNLTEFYSVFLRILIHISWSYFSIATVTVCAYLFRL
jgi:hypothetical protein